MVTTLAVTAMRTASPSTTMAMKATSQFGRTRTGQVLGPEDLFRPRIERMSSTSVSLAAASARTWIGGGTHHLVSRIADGDDCQT
jgi:hypothetical protein